MKKSIFGAFFILVSQPMLGNSADLIPPRGEEPVVRDSEDRPTPFLEGPYAGLSFGFGNMNAKFTDTCDCEAFAGMDSRRVGVFIGQNWNVAANTWFGLESDLNYDWREINFDGATVGTDLSGSIRARVGESFGKAFIYTTVGLAYGNGFVKNPDENKMVQGWTAGLGVDWSLSDTTFLRAEYRYTDYDTVKLSGVDVKFDQDIFAVSIARRF